MGDTGWKKHERYVASYFFTERRKRGADFSVSDCEVIADVGLWMQNSSIKDEIKGHSNILPKNLVVECKHGKQCHGLQAMFSSHHQDNPDVQKLITLVNWQDTVGLCFLDRNFKRCFDYVWADIIHQLPITGPELIDRYSITRSDKKIPSYLSEWMLQAWQYSKHYNAYGTLCIHSAGGSGRVMVFPWPGSVGDSWIKNLLDTT